MNRPVLAKKRAIMASLLLVILAAASFGFWDLNNNAQGAIIDPHPGLVGWWSFNEGTGTVAGDSSGNSNSAVTNGAVWVDGKYGKALSFNGANSYVETNSPLNVGTVFTLTAWINRSSLDKAFGYVISNGPSGGASNKFAFYPIAQFGYRLCLESGDGTHNELNHGNTVVPQNSWTYVALVINNGVGTFYLNGVPDGTFTLTYPNFNKNAKIEIGQSQDKYVDCFFGGIIDEARIYNRALSASEIQAEFGGAPEIPTNLQAKIPIGTTQVITTLSWQGTASINATIISPSQTYTESMLPTYQKTTFSTIDGTSNMLNIKRLSISVNALTSNQNWNISLMFDNPVPYQITVEVQK
jgi:hypothetical protein